MAKPAPRDGLRRAMDQKQLVLFYQPIHEIESRRIIAAEALLRARRRTGEIRNAQRLAAAAERGPDLFRLDSWTVQRAYADAAQWQSNGGPDVRLNVNLSPREFEEAGLSTRLKKLVTGSGADPHKVNIELTETSPVISPKKTMHALEQLKHLGVALWLDDFGTGFSTLSHVLHFPLDGIKVPAEFVEKIASDQRSQAIVRHIVGLAHELELKVIAEGVETNDQLEVMRDIGCDYLQGFLFSKPMPLEELERTLRGE